MKPFGFTVLLLVIGLPRLPLEASMANRGDAATVVEYYRRKENVPSQASVQIESVQNSPIGGVKEGTLSDRGRKVPFVMSNDGRFVVFGKLEDMTVDPFAAVMEKIDIEGRPARGPADAKVTIVEYSDFECSFCVRAYQVAPSPGFTNATTEKSLTDDLYQGYFRS